MANALFNPQHCPLCGEANQCAMAAAKESAPNTLLSTQATTASQAPSAEAPCWCVGVRFSPDLLAQVPAAAQGKACVCQRCACAASSSASSELPLTRDHH